MSEMQCPNRWTVEFDLETEHDIREMGLDAERADEYRTARRKLTARAVAELADASARATFVLQEGFRSLGRAVTRGRES